MTLIELLIVIFILLLITATSIPLMVSGVQGRKLREAARLASSFIASARTRAIENGRPAGVRIERFDGAPNVAMRLSLVEVPPPYAGGTEQSRAWINIDASNRHLVFALGVPPLNSMTQLPQLPDAIPPGLIHSGDLIKFDYQGRSFAIHSSDPKYFGRIGVELGAPYDKAPWVLLPLDGDARFPLPTGADGVPYQITRQPQPAAGKSLQLPEGTVIDLDLSGGEHIWAMGSGTSQSAMSPLILFSPGGAVSAVFDQHDPTKPPDKEPPEIHPPAAPLYLHIGRREGASDIAKFGDAKNPRNLYDLNNFWIGIGYQTGLVTTSETGVKPKSELEVDWPVKNPTQQQVDDFNRHLRYARGIAKTAQSMGGR